MGAVLIWCVSAIFVHAADIRITEIMYDVVGSDAGREWIEVCNTGISDISLTEWKLFENDTNHTIKAAEEGGEETLPLGECAVIADNPALFLEDYAAPAYFFDSAFSLKNTGEEIVLRNVEESDIDTVLYDPGIGAEGDGNSLSLTSSAIWVAAAPTPGNWDGAPPAPVENGDEDDGEDDTSAEDTDTDDSLGTSGGGGQWIPDPDIHAYAGKDREVVAGADIVFEGYAGDASGEEMKIAEYVWNFGDGEVKRGKSLLHTFRYPGTYIAHLTVISGDLVARDTATILATEPDVQIVGYERGGLDPYVALRSNADTPINLSWWYVRIGGALFHIPEHTYIASNTELRFSQAVMNIDFPETNDVALLYPNLRTVDMFDVPAHTAESARGAVTPESSQTSIPPRAAQPSSQSQTPPTVSYTEISETTVSEEGSEDESVAEDQTSSVYYSLTANASKAQANRQAWFFALGGIIILGIAGVTVIHRKDESAQLQLQQKAAPQESNADEYEILEDDE